MTRAQQRAAYMAGVRAALAAASARITKGEHAGKVCTVLQVDAHDSLVTIAGVMVRVPNEALS